jgi:hypothetical protein
MARPASGTNLTIAQLQRVLNDKQSELQKLQRQRMNLQKKLAILDRQIDRVGGGAALNGSRGRGGAGPAGGFTASGRARNDRSLLDTLEGIMRQHAKPMKVQEILDGVLATGYRSGSANFRGIINQTLIKDKRFGQVQRGVYELKSGGGESKKKSSGKTAAA